MLYRKQWDRRCSTAFHFVHEIYMAIVPRRGIVYMRCDFQEILFAVHRVRLHFDRGITRNGLLDANKKKKRILPLSVAWSFSIFDR